MKKIILLYTFCLLSWCSFGQNPIQSVVDSTQVKIGAPIEYIIKAKVSKDDQVKFPNQPKFGDFEVIDQQPIDTILKENQWELIKKYTLIQFDSGTYTVPRLSVFVNQKNFQTDFHQVQVSNVAVDTLKQPMYDIKPTFEVSATSSDLLWKYLIALVLVLLVAGVVYFIIRWIQNKNLTEEDLFRTPLEKTVAQLAKLDDHQWIQKGEIKQYYSDLSDIVREYIEEVFDIPAKESTTKELMFLLVNHIKKQKIKLNKTTTEALQHLLETADLVKFAKMQPAVHEVEMNRKQAQLVADDVNVAIPKFSEEQSAKVRLREQRYQRRRRIRIWAPIVVALIGILGVGTHYLVQRYQNTEWTWFQTNQSLYEQEWVVSDYGYPALTLSTPKVLARKPMPVQAKQKEAPQEGVFAYENSKTKLSIVAQTKEMNTEEINLEEELKGKLRFMEQTLLFTQLEQSAKTFKQNQVSGIQSTGTYQKVIDNQPVKMAFELLLFSQKEGTQMLWISYPADDTYGEKIAQRVIENIQLNVVQNDDE